MGWLELLLERPWPAVRCALYASHECVWPPHN